MSHTRVTMHHMGPDLEDIKADLEQKVGALPEGFDASVALSNRRYEKMVKLVVNGTTQTDAYISTSNTLTTRKSAKEGASAIMRRPDVAARMAWLRDIDESRPPKNAPKKHNLRTKEGLARKLEELVHAGDSRNPEVISAVKELASLYGIRGPDASMDAHVDPGQLGAWLTRQECAGVDPATLLKEDGLERVLAAISKVLAITREQASACLASPTFGTTQEHKPDDEADSLEDETDGI